MSKDSSKNAMCKFVCISTNDLLLNYIMCSFKSNGNIQKKEGGPDKDLFRIVNTLSSVTLNGLAIKARGSML